MARSRRRRTTTERAAGLLALALPAPVQRVADTPIGSLLMLVGIPAMLVFGCLNIKFVDGFPTLSLNGQKAAELQRVASQHLSELEHQVASQNWGAASDFLRTAQSSNPSYYPNASTQTQQPSAAYLAQQQQYQYQQQQQQLQQRQAYQQPLYQQQQSQYGQPIGQQQSYAQQTYPSQAYPNQTYTNQNYQQPSFQQPNYQQPNIQQPTYQQPTYQQPTYQQPGYPPQGYQQAATPQQTYQPSSYQQSANPSAYGGYGQIPAQTTGYPVPVQQNNRMPLPSTTNSSQRQFNQPGSLLR